MRTERANAFLPRSGREGDFNIRLLGRLGQELASIYHDTLRSPLPPGLQASIDRLDGAIARQDRTRK